TTSGPANPAGTFDRTVREPRRLSVSWSATRPHPELRIVAAQRTNDCQSPAIPQTVQRASGKSVGRARSAGCATLCAWQRTAPILGRLQACAAHQYRARVSARKRATWRAGNTPPDGTQNVAAAALHQHECRTAEPRR